MSSGSENIHIEEVGPLFAGAIADTGRMAVTIDQASEILGCGVDYGRRLLRTNEVWGYKPSRQAAGFVYDRSEVERLAAQRRVAPIELGYICVRQAANLIGCSVVHARNLLGEAGIIGSVFPGQGKAIFYHHTDVEGIAERLADEGVDEDLIDVEEAAEILGCSKPHVKTLTQQASVSGQKVPGQGRKIFFEREDIKRIAAQRGRSPVQEGYVDLDQAEIILDQPKAMVSTLLKAMNIKGVRRPGQGKKLFFLTREVQELASTRKISSEELVGFASRSCAFNQ